MGKVMAAVAATLVFAASALADSGQTSPYGSEARAAVLAQVNQAQQPGSYYAPGGQPYQQAMPGSQGPELDAWGNPVAPYSTGMQGQGGQYQPSPGYNAATGQYQQPMAGQAGQYYAPGVGPQGTPPHQQLLQGQAQHFQPLGDPYEGMDPQYAGAGQTGSEQPLPASVSQSGQGTLSQSQDNQPQKDGKLHHALGGLGKALQVGAGIAAPLAGSYMMGKMMNRSGYGYGYPSGYGMPYGSSYGMPYGGYGMPYGSSYGMPYGGGSGLLGSFGSLLHRP